MNQQPSIETVKQSVMASSKMSATATALPALVTPASAAACHGGGGGAGNNGGHKRSSSLENAPRFSAKNTLGLPPALVGSNHCGTLKSRNEQRLMRNKFGSHCNLEDYVQRSPTVAPSSTPSTGDGCDGGAGGGGGGSNASVAKLRESSKFHNIRQMFELSKYGGQAAQCDNVELHQMQSLPPIIAATATLAQSQLAGALQQQQQRAKQPPVQRKATFTPANRNSLTETPSERFTPNDCCRAATPSATPPTSAGAEQQQQARHQQQTAAYLQRKYSRTLSQQQQQQQKPLFSPPHQRSVNGGLAHLQQRDGENVEQATNLLRPIAFKPIPFEPDYSITNRYCYDVITTASDGGGTIDRYGSTPLLAPTQSSAARFGSTTDLRHGGCAAIGSSNGLGLLVDHVRCGIGSGGEVNASGLILDGGGGGGGVCNYASNNYYCNSLMARRRGGSRSLKINDSMESIRRSTPDSEEHNQSSAIKVSGGMTLVAPHSLGNHHNSNISNNCTIANNCNSSNNKNKKYITLSGGVGVEQCDMTPSPSDSGISDLEPATKDRDSDLSYLRQAMEHTEKDKESQWEDKTTRLKSFYDGQQREYALKMKKLEQMLAMQQFQFKQHKMKHTEHSNKLREQLADLKNENEILRSNNGSLKTSERNLIDRLAYVEEQLKGTQNLIVALKTQLEENEWKVCERNGEIALLKCQLKEANMEITLKEHALVHLKHEALTTNADLTQKEARQAVLEQQQQQIHSNSGKCVAEVELRQLNKIIVMKDQVILALTNELAKLRKEFSDLAIFHEYGEEPSGKYVRLKQQLEHLTDICYRTRHQTQETLSNPDHNAKDHMIDEINLELIMNCLKLAPTLPGASNSNGVSTTCADADHKMMMQLTSGKMISERDKNVPNVESNTKYECNYQQQQQQIQQCDHQRLEESTLNTLIEESASYADEIAKLRQQLDDVRVNFEIEKRQWSEEKEKVLKYQKIFQAHYISMYHKLRCNTGNCSNPEEV